jgi:hypothetical protein
MEEDGDEPSAPSCRLAVACFFFFASLPSVTVFHGRHHPATSRTWPAHNTQSSTQSTTQPPFPHWHQPPTGIP